MNILGLIPARGGSKRVPKKNIKLFLGKPLIYYAINEALKSKYINRLVVSTDDQFIARIAKRYGADVPFMRPKILASDQIGDYPVIKHAILWFDKHNWKPDCIVFLRPTNIFRTAKEIDMAIEKFLNSNYDSIRGISMAVYPPYWMKKIRNDMLIPFIDTKYKDVRRQDLPEVYQGNGTIEVIRRRAILEKKCRFGKRVGFIKMDDIAAVDIDTELDFKMAEFLYPLWKKGLK